MHIPVLKEEVFSFLNLQPNKTFLDCTLGFGGHSSHLSSLTSHLKIIGIEQDEEAIARIQGHQGQQGLKGMEGIKVVKGNFKDLKVLVKEKVDGVLFDLGVSSYQIDTPDRGFSWRFDSPLDMRMDQTKGKTAAQYILGLSEDELGNIFNEYGEERFARRIAKQVKERLPQTTFELKEVVEKAIPGWRKRESVTRIFQALRILVNSELENLKKALPQAVELLNPSGRIVIISYHSLEDRIVKHFFKEAAKNAILKILTKKPITASEKEQKSNPRSRGAKLRAALRL